ncbi:NEDD8-activating enzyme E1 catalytic subunit-like isoform X2 [Symsagittifera roscoffensis]|uniref:NEDD8-activating enzyme E1 catalytic subunit-like isoform X2 n=1 Tax=Symsagittifera roscoffensis TaxID=84072 RepID=UPI00307B12F9
MAAFEMIECQFIEVQRLLERPSAAFSNEKMFEADPQLFAALRGAIQILVLGAGGLGCELLKDLAMLGFENLHVIDMDTIDLSNLNRQFLFRYSDIGRPKAEIAADFVNKRVPTSHVTAHFNKIEDLGPDFYERFHIVVCGLDSISARRWINQMLISLLKYSADGKVIPESVKPLVDGGTEGFKGSARLIYPGMSACIDCTLDLYPPQIHYPLCTIAHTPRLPEHCVEFAKIMAWPEEEPFGKGVEVDGDHPDHVTWIMMKAQERADHFGIKAVTYRFRDER